MVLTVENFEKEVIKSDKPVLVDFWASWCGPCKMQGPILEELEKEEDSFLIGKVDVDKEWELRDEYQISAIPSLLVFKDGKCVDTMVGLQTKEKILGEMKQYI